MISRVRFAIINDSTCSPRNSIDLVALNYEFHVINSIRHFISPCHPIIYEIPRVHIIRRFTIVGLSTNQEYLVELL
jgi:hypothetical protein